MIDRDQLTEALDLQRDMANRWDVLEAVARLLLDFPTDEQVEAFRLATWSPPSVIRDGLEAVRQVMFGEQQ